MTSQQFFKAAEQLKMLTEYTNTVITGRGKSDKIDTINQYIESISKFILQSYIESSLVIYYKQDGQEYVDIIKRDNDPDHTNYYLRSYVGYLNLNWDSYQHKFKNILDFSRYKPNKNPDIITYCDE